MSETILLVRPAEQNVDGSRAVFTPPIGLWSMRTNSFGKEIWVVDKSIWEYPTNFNVETIGYSVLFPAHMRSIKDLRHLMHAEREVIGGPTGGLVGFQNMEKIYGSGESWLAGRDVPFSELLPPVFGIHEMKPYWKQDKPFGLPSKKRWMVLETSRGCPYACNYCAIPLAWGNWSERSILMLDGYLQWLKSIGIEEVIVIDDNVALKAERFINIISLFKKHDLFWSCSNGVFNRTLLNGDVLRALKNSKCLYFSLPFEAGNARSAELMNLGRKYITFEEAKEITASIRELGIHTAGQFIIGYPGETEEDIRATLRYANALTLNERHVHIATPLRGTRMYADCIRNNYIQEEDIERATYKTPIINTPVISAERVYALWLEDRQAALARKDNA